jgi:hypothetical protein
VSTLNDARKFGCPIVDALAPYNLCMQSNSSDEWSRLTKYENGVWAFLVLAGILALSLVIYMGYLLV